jgi:hypothetical protein
MLQVRGYSFTFARRASNDRTPYATEAKGVGSLK